MNIPDEQEVAEVINSFDIPGWKNVSADQIKVSSLGAGYMNVTCKVEKKSSQQSTGCTEGPKCLVYKKYGGNKYSELSESITENNSPLVQSIISYELSRRGWAPKLYGLLDNVRIEEFVEACTLDHSKAFQTDLINDTAKAFAQFHTLKLPFKKPRVDILSDKLFHALCNKEPLSKWLDTFKGDETAIRAYRNILAFPIESELQWLRSVRDKMKNKFVLASLDPNYLNRLVRKDKCSDVNFTRVLIIDYDASGYAHRGADLGGHFVSRTLDVSRKGDKTSGAPYPNKEERTAFLKAYRSHLSTLDEDFDEKLDSLDQITLEADLYALVLCWFYILFFHTSHITHDAEPFMCTMYDPIIRLYSQLKSDFCSEYPHLVKIE